MKRETVIFDAKGLTLGRLATKVALALRGKNSPNFTPYLDPEIEVKITNASAITLTGTKFETKRYHRYTGYPGNQRVETPKQIIGKKGYGEVLRQAVRGMLPPNRLRAKFLKRLIIEE